MKEKWFVFRNDHHEGPYSVEQISLSYRQGKIQAETLVWKEGLEHWSPLKGLDCFKELFSEDLSPPQTEKKAERPSLLPPLPSPIPTPDPTPAPIPASTSTGPRPPTERPRVAKGSHLYFYFIFFSIILFVGLLSYSLFFWPQSAQPSLVQLNISPTQKESIREVLRSRSHSHLLGLTSDQNNIWFVYGLPLNGSISLYLKSQQHRILSSEKSVEVFSSGTITTGLASFKNFETLRGDSLVLGEYDYTIYIHPEGLLANVGRLLKSKNLLHSQLDIFGHVIKLTGTFHYYGDDKEDFEKKLEALNDKKYFQEQGMPLIDQLEKLRVFFSMMEQANNFFEKNIQEVKVGDDFTSFKIHYIEKVSPLLQKITLDSYQQSMDLMDSEIEKANEHLEIFENGKSVMKFMSDTIEQTTNVEYYTPSIRENISKKFKVQYQDILQTLHESLEKRKQKSSTFLKKQ